MLHHFLAASPLHGARYKFYVEAATVVVLFYVGFTDFRTFKIRNESVALLLVLYIIYALIARSPYDFLLNVAVKGVEAVFVVLLCFYARGAIGGGDVKLVSVVCLWIGTHCVAVLRIASSIHWIPRGRCQITFRLDPTDGISPSHTICTFYSRCADWHYFVGLSVTAAGVCVPSPDTRGGTRCRGGAAKKFLTKDTEDGASRWVISTFALTVTTRP